MTKTAYLAESWFNDEQNALREAGMKAVKANKSIDWENSYRPIEHQYKGWKITDHPDLFSNKEWQLATFNGDVTAIQNMDMTIALYDPKIENSDPGVIWELGMAYGIRKPAYVVLPDDCEIPLNLMPAMGATQTIKLSELADFNFDNIVYKVIDQEVY